jgi:hypothetical protein
VLALLAQGLGDGLVDAEQLLRYQRPQFGIVGTE